MGHVPPPLAELTAQARTLSSAGDLVGAREVLAGALTPVDADPRRASPDLANAAALLARILIALGDPHAARVWAGFAHAAEDRLHGPNDERTVAAAALHAAVLHRIGSYGRAAHIYRDLVGQLTSLDGTDSPRVLAAEADLATAEHAGGDCDVARARLAEAWARHRHSYGEAEPSGIKMLARLGAMERECGRDAEAQEHLGLAQALCARYLPADHPLARQAAVLAQAPQSGKHTCGQVERSAGPSSAPGVRPVHRPAPPGVRRVGPPAVPERDPDDATTDEIPEAEPDDRETDPNGSIYQQPLYLSDLRTPPGDLTGRHARADTPPPLPGQRPPELGPDGREKRIGAAELPASLKFTPPDRRLPVPTERRESRSWQPLVLVAALVLGIAVAAAVVVAMLPRGGVVPRATSSSVSPATSVSRAPVATVAPSPPASSAPVGGPAPAKVHIVDNRDSVSLTWTYPKGSEGPVLISGGRTGQIQRAFQQLPAGTSNYVVYGLNTQSNYCFTVAIVYTVDDVAASKQLCTRRK